MLLRLMGSKTSLVLLKFLQSINMKKNNMNINHKYISDKSNFKKLISLLIKTVIIFNIIINTIVIENSNEKELFMLWWFN